MSAAVYTMKEVQEILHISRNHAYVLVQRGELPSVRLGKKILIPKHRVAQMLDAQQSKG
jgi:excisionase family DNA binding protein